jgi:hypothetical protein
MSKVKAASLEIPLVVKALQETLMLRNEDFN